jgi:hypothetical protein
MKKTAMALSFLTISLFFVVAIAGTVFYYDGVVSDRDSKIESMNSQIAILNEPNEQRENT